MRFDDIIGSQIEEAMARGEFDNLRGKGKPFAWQENPFVDPGQERAFQIMKDNDFVPRWIGEKQEIAAAANQIHTRLTRYHQQYSLTRDKAWWERRVEEIRKDAAALNQRIRTYNLIAPTPSQHLLLLNVAAELYYLTCHEQVR